MALLSKTNGCLIILSRLLYKILFHDSSQQENPSALLNNRYKVETAVHYSNTGDVYLGTDTIGNRKVIIKEARPISNPLHQVIVLTCARKK